MKGRPSEYGECSCADAAQTQSREELRCHALHRKLAGPTASRVAWDSTIGDPKFTCTYLALCLLVAICMGARPVTYAQEAPGSPAATEAGQADSAGTLLEEQRPPEIRYKLRPSVSELLVGTAAPPLSVSEASYPE